MECYSALKRNVNLKIITRCEQGQAIKALILHYSIYKEFQNMKINL